ncbi:PIG-L deacetylase family protein [Granulicella arctica]|uniref:LmbE family N-acetylglucosaminyl deacetylase n=1 Tax=Granulicella arctica TaxID=940613 RepID=A0A7Y9PF76_9BACT|nr:PIG-L family deacetylase [Granulicella arctica]NYF78063.1 LmbE family N-acetylglucosaminyl deacetylase [Granulicella arctica]
MKILILSPHRGDAAFSLSLALLQWLKAGHAVTILNCFSRSLHAPFSDAEFTHPNDRLSYVSAMRKREDEAFLRQLSPTQSNKLKMIDLNLKDAPIRLQCTADESFERPVNPEDPAIAKIHKGITRLREESSIDALVLPLGLGNHVDHRTVRDAALAFAAELPSAFYEDLPDATRPGHAAEDLAAQLSEPLSPVIVTAPAAVATKRKLISKYVSQIDDEILEAISTFATPYNGGERFWANQAWLNATSS